MKHEQGQGVRPSNTRMAQLAQAVLALPGVHGELVPGPFRASELQLLVVVPGAGCLSVLPDLDTAALYEAVLPHAGGDRLWDKLTLQQVIDLVNRLRTVDGPSLEDSQ